jgi:hypothetical protein
VAGGWAADGAVQQQIDDSIKDAVERARAQLSAGSKPDTVRRMRSGHPGGPPARCSGRAFVRNVSERTG